MDRLLSSASTLVGGRDPEAARAAPVSQAMEPVVGQYARDVAAGQGLASGLQSLTARQNANFDPAGQNSPPGTDAARLPGRVWLGGGH